NFSLAIGYAAIFWPEFTRHEGYILRKGFNEESLKGFERQEGASRKNTEWIMNHLHIEDIQYLGCPDMTRDKVLVIGHILKEIHEAKLKWQFPDDPCRVEFYISDDQNDLTQYQISFWQQRHD
ncbi:MAG: hypothetical protein LBS49_07955, partial [Candidatus Accumulibacter sp.]|nr:hypothetical protein [Accumulibacter sp.]